MSEVACTNCKGACCKGTPLLILQLDGEESAFMKRGGNTLLTVAEPANIDRDEVIYPQGAQFNDNQTFNWLGRPGDEYEPLPANYGRYALIGACAYLEVSPLGDEYCGVYEERPQVCRDFEVASEKCLLVRTIHEVPLPMPQARQER